jgi:hypothetical protein
MKRRRDAALPARLAKARDRFEAWRKSRERRSAIPEKLWMLATRLAQDFGVHPVSKALRVNHERLQARVGTSAARARRPRKPRSPFVELPPNPPIFSPPCVVELEKPSGAKMRISLQGLGDAELVSLTSAFLSTER